MHFATMQALAVGGQGTFFGRLSAPGFLIAPAAFPAQLVLAGFADAALGIVVLGIGRAPLSIHFSLQPSDGLFVWSEFLAEHGEAGFPLAGNKRDRGGAQVRADDVASYRVFRLVVGYPF
jgi:hypothetical protein